MTWDGQFQASYGRPTVEKAAAGGSHKVQYGRHSLAHLGRRHSCALRAGLRGEVRHFLTSPGVATGLNKRQLLAVD